MDEDVQLLEKHLCNGCAGCAALCPAGAISMQTDQEGFAYPVIDRDRCIRCRACVTRCPVKVRLDGDAPSGGKEPACWIAYNKNTSARLPSSSGGIFSALAQAVLARGGLVFGAAWAKDFSVAHRAIDSPEDIALLRGSKYIQSDVNTTYSQARAALEEGRPVLYVGTSCQIGGLQSNLGRDWPDLYCVDLICLGVASPAVWQGYLGAFRRPEKLRAINWKDKTHGWHRYSLRFDYGGKNRIVPGDKSLFMYGYYQNLYLRPACSHCAYRGLARSSDITLADAWGIEDFAPDMDDGKGCSSVLVHTEKGARLFEAVRPGLEAMECSAEQMLAKNPYAVSCVAENPRRNAFYSVFCRRPGPALLWFCHNLPQRSLLSAKNAVKKLLGIFRGKPAHASAAAAKEQR